MNDGETTNKERSLGSSRLNKSAVDIPLVLHLAIDWCHMMCNALWRQFHIADLREIGSISSASSEQGDRLLRDVGGMSI